jgi:hypothetical protein
MHEVDLQLPDQAAEPGDPAHVERVGGTEAVHRYGESLEVGHQGVLPRQQVRHFELEVRAVETLGRADHESFGAPSPETLGEPEDADRR